MLAVDVLLRVFIMSNAEYVQAGSFPPATLLGSVHHLVQSLGQKRLVLS